MDSPNYQKLIEEGIENGVPIADILKDLEEVLTKDQEQKSNVKFKESWKITARKPIASYYKAGCGTPPTPKELARFCTSFIIENYPNWTTKDIELYASELESYMVNGAKIVKATDKEARQILDKELDYLFDNIADGWARIFSKNKQEKKESDEVDSLESWVKEMFG